MARIETQGIVSARTGEPYVQFRSIADDDTLLAEWQLTPQEARDFALVVLEASLNAVHDAAIVSWAKESDMPQGAWVMLLDGIRRHRADRWGLPDQPEDWMQKEE